MELLKTLEGLRTPFLDTVFGFATRLGEETVAVVVICAIFWCINKRSAYMIGIAFFLSGLTVQGMKVCFRIDRPWVADPTLSPVTSALDAATGYSFPSGHVQSASALFGSLGVQMKKKPLKALCLFAIVLVAFSRLYLGVHTLPDVGISLVISLLLVVITIKVIPGALSDKKHATILAMVLMLFAVAVVIVALALYLRGLVEQEYLSDCLKAAGAGVGFVAGMYIESFYIGFSVKAKSLLWQIIKMIIGIAGVLAIKEGFKMALGVGLAIDTVRYFLMIIWVTVVFPLIIKRFFAIDSR